MDVIIADDRPEWIKAEDKVMACLTRCPSYKKCSSRIGWDCKQLGGSEIPKLNNVRKGRAKHASHSRKKHQL